jgi:hypothetical protein
MALRMRAGVLADPGLAGDLADDASGAVPVEPPAVGPGASVVVAALAALGQGDVGGCDLLRLVMLEPLGSGLLGRLRGLSAL